MVAQLPVEPERCFDRSLGCSRCAPEETGLTPLTAAVYGLSLANHIEPAVHGAASRGYFSFSRTLRRLRVLCSVTLVPLRPARALGAAVRPDDPCGDAAPSPAIRGARVKRHTLRRGYEMLPQTRRSVRSQAPPR